MLKLENVWKTFNKGTVNEKVALQRLNLEMKEGDFVTVIGGNGAGKSTMLNAIAGVFGVDSGSITIDGVDVTNLPEYKRAKYIGRVFQDPMMGTAATMQIEENLALAARRGQSRTLRPGITKAEREEYMEQLISQLTSNTLTDENRMVAVLCQRFIGAWIVNDHMLKEELYTRLINLMEADLSKYPAYAGSEAYKLNHFKPYENHAEDSAFHFVG